MPKPELRDHRKFLKLKRLLGEPTPHVLGYLDCLWHRGYQTGSPFVGDALDVEGAAEYPGEPGKFAKAALEAGFLDTDSGGFFSIHDLFEHAPAYAKKRMIRRGTDPKSVQTANSGNQVVPFGNDLLPRGTKNAENDAARHTEPRSESREPKAENQEPKAENLKPPQQQEAEAAEIEEDLDETPGEFRDAWNEAAKENGWRQCDKMTTDRENHYRARLKDPHWRKNWRSALFLAGPIPALRGIGNDRKWKATIDWFLRAGTVAKITEGTYDDWGKDEKSTNGGTNGQFRSNGATPHRFNGQVTPLEAAADAAGPRMDGALRESGSPGSVPTG